MTSSTILFRNDKLGGSVDDVPSDDNPAVLPSSSSQEGGNVIILCSAGNRSQLGVERVMNWLVPPSLARTPSWRASDLSLATHTLKFKDSPKLPGPTPLVNPLGPKKGAYSSGTQLNWTLARPCW